MAIFEGAGVALVTPFKENGAVNYEVLESLIEEQIAGGTDCIVAMGTTGESATTSEEEHIQVIRFVCEVVNGRIPVVAGTGSNCTQTAVELSVEAEAYGLREYSSVRPSLHLIDSQIPILNIDPPSTQISRIIMDCQKFE